jgi:2-polyprenyl-3-methyl-5-hydroxy-6-metoxy-1,4-benzoquinol methylase
MMSNPARQSAPACPICGGTVSHDFAHPEAALYRCRACQHRFSLLNGAPEEYGADYYLETHRNWFANPDLELFRWVVAQMAGLPPGARVLDVGCGRGAFLRYLRSQRPDLILVGLELAELDPVEGITFIAEDLRTFQPPELFDAVVSFSVIEHLPDPVEFSGRLAAFCQPGGMIVVTTPDDGGVLYTLGRIAKRLGVGMLFNRLYATHHLNHFSRTSLGRCLSGAGLEVVTVYGHDAPMAAIDLPVSNPMAVTILRGGLVGVFVLGRLLDRTYLQTQLARRPS